MKSCFRKAKTKSRRRDFPTSGRRHTPPPPSLKSSSLYARVFFADCIPPFPILSYFSLSTSSPTLEMHRPIHREFPRPVNGSVPSHPYFSPDFPIKPCNRCSPGIIFGTKIEPVLSPERAAGYGYKRYNGNENNISTSGELSF